MKKRSITPGRLVMAVGIAAVLILAACATHAGPSASRASDASAAGRAEVVLEYKMPEGRVLRYQTNEESREILDVMGQVVETTSTTTSAFSIEAKGLKDSNHLLGVTIDDMSSSIASMMGDMSPDMKPVIGKSFDMVVSPLGIEIDVSGAEALTYESPSGTSNLASGFKVFFFDLPGKPVKAGDSWPTNFVIEEKNDAMNVRIDMQSVNTLEGFETVDGMECARIIAKNTGTISGTGFQQGMDFEISGTITGTETWYFAPKEGLYVKSKGEYGGDIMVSASGMTFPMTQTRTSEIKLVSK